MIVVLQCSAKKRRGIYPAWDLYRGPLFTVSFRYARMLAEPKDIYILSGKYGLIRSLRPIQSYDQRIGEFTEELEQRYREQAMAYGILEESRVILLTGKDYRRHLLPLWPDAETPLEGKGGMVRMMAWMNRQRKEIS